MGFGGWSRFRQWLKNRIYTAVWPIVRSRIFVKLKSIVSKCIVPAFSCGVGAAIGAGAAFALGKYGIFVLEELLLELFEVAVEVEINGLYETSGLFGSACWLRNAQWSMSCGFLKCKFEVGARLQMFPKNWNPIRSHGILYHGKFVGDDLGCVPGV